jgi:hypothetical protein
MPKHYLGDGVFADFDTDTLNVILTTEDGERETNRIVLEPEILDALGRYVQREVYRRNAPTPAPELIDARRALEDADASDPPASAADTDGKEG